MEMLWSACSTCGGSGTQPLGCWWAEHGLEPSCLGSPRTGIIVENQHSACSAGSTHEAEPRGPGQGLATPKERRSSQLGGCRSLVGLHLPVPHRDQYSLETSRCTVPWAALRERGNGARKHWAAPRRHKCRVHTQGCGVGGGSGKGVGSPVT